MANKQQSCTPWKSASTAVGAVEDDGDILAPLKTVREKYLAKAAELDEKAFGDKTLLILRTAAHYRTMADCVNRVIGLVAEEDLAEQRGFLSDEGENDTAKA